jgi:hypothetical protein
LQLLVLAALAWPMVLAAPSAQAADSAAVKSAMQRFERDRMVCAGGRSNQDRATCMHEAAAALAEVKRGRPANANESFKRNARLRCEVLQDDDRADCEARMHGQGTTSGSVAGGGIYRELVTREVGTVSGPAASAPTAR